ncbi:Gag-pol polyprotein [Elysia marginata]|uniref:Gag-pol polyprotein n=1 Tax=Elysia marginata TaxID=1093978 RepID=A0AAV4FZL4_9GAST|nr:Gag-pol polyprotein [Elysia marginata]
MRRAVHIELVDPLTTEDTVLALRRFSARRGIPAVIYSDNARKASQLIQGEMGHTTTTWKFNAPLALWWGGWWERPIRSTNQDFANHLGKIQ